MNDRQPSRMNQILDLLVEEIEERMRARVQPARSAVEEILPPGKPPAAEVSAPSAARPDEWVEPVEAPAPLEEVGEGEPLEPVPELELEMELEAELEMPTAPRGPSHAARLMGRLALGLLVAIVLINIPFNRHGTTLATAMPDTAALVIRDGLVVKEEDDEEIYVLHNGKFRWISSLDAFDQFGFTWGDVHVVEDGFLDDFEIGAPLHVLLKCHASPHIYRAEGGKKRWIRDIAAFEAEGHVWEDVRFVSCGYLRDLPDGETIPPGSGPPPQP